MLSLQSFLMKVGDGFQRGAAVAVPRAINSMMAANPAILSAKRMVSFRTGDRSSSSVVLGAGQ
jgi:hypothetical protein